MQTLRVWIWLRTCIVTTLLLGSVAVSQRSSRNVQNQAKTLIEMSRAQDSEKVRHTKVSSFESYLKDNAKPLILSEGELKGAGASWLQSEARGAQFVLIGEDHGLAELEVLTGALWRLAVPLGYGHLALEEGPWNMSLADDYVRGGRKESLLAYQSAALKGSPPTSLEHLAMIRSLRDTLPHRASAIVWGLDQERRAVPLLSRLVTLARTPAARDAAEQALFEARRRENDGHYLLDGYSELIQSLRRAFADRPSAEASWLLRLMETSNRVYDDNSAAPGEQRGYEANETRENMMKDSFLEAYRAAQHSGEQRPRVLLRVGQWHGMRGLSPTQVPTLGNFISEFARSQGGRMFNIVATCATGERSGIGKAASQIEPCGTDEEPWFKIIQTALIGPITIFDLRPLRGAHHGGIEVPTEVVPYIYSYDALLVIAKSGRLHFQDSQSPD